VKSTLSSVLDKLFFNIGVTRRCFVLDWNCMAGINDLVQKIPDGGIFLGLNPCGRTKTLTEMSTRKVAWGVNWAGA
jgi:hypothetical protein